MSDPSLVEPESRSAPDASPGRRGLSNAHLWVLALVCLFYLLLCHIPLRSSDLWIHETYGRWILDNGRLPEADPVLELAEGVSVVDRDWVSQVVFAALNRAGGGELLSLLFAFTMVSSYLVLGRAYYLQAGALGPAVVASAAALGVGFSRLATIRPENLGLLCFALLLLVLLTTRALERCGGCSVPLDWPRWVWLAVPALLALWTNVHGSFAIGILVLACAAAGRLLEVGWLSRSLRVAFEDVEGRRRLWLLQLGFAATLLNPYGMGIWVDVATFSAHPNLRDIVEWQPLVILGPGGREFAASVVILMLLLRHVRRRVPVSHALLLVAVAAGVLTGNRFLTWYAPVFSLVVAPLMGDLWRRWQGGRERHDSESRAAGVLTSRVRWVLAAVLIWVTFALTPQGSRWLGGEPRTPAQLYGQQTPLDVTAYLKSRRPAGLVWAPQWWADWLVRQGPPGLRSMITSNIHLIPQRVWRDYMRVQEGQVGWGDVLDRYRVDVVVLDLAHQRSQANALRRDPAWNLAFEDEQAMVFLRRAQGPAVAEAAAPEGAAS